MFGINIDFNNLILGGTVYVGMVFAAFWLAMVIWAFRDMRARSRDLLAQIIVAVMVAVLNLPGLLIYMLLRPRETLSEAYERSLEEEALLQEIEEKPRCPGCGQNVQAAWQVCPNCHTRLKKPCLACGKTLELAWTICPYCATAQENYVATTNHARPVSVPEQYAPSAAGSYESSRSTRSSARVSETLEFVDGDEY